jgi:hypothetical protein
MFVYKTKPVIMNNKNNIILIMIGTFLSAPYSFFKVIGSLHFPLLFSGHHYWFYGSLGFTSFVGVILIFMGLYNIYKENRREKSN